MPIAWYITPYRRNPAQTRPMRYCAMQDATSVLGPDVEELHLFVDIRRACPSHRRALSDKQ